MMSQTRERFREHLSQSFFRCALGAGVSNAHVEPNIICHLLHALLGEGEVRAERGIQDVHLVVDHGLAHLAAARGGGDHVEEHLYHHGTGGSGGAAQPRGGRRRGGGGGGALGQHSPARLLAEQRLVGRHVLHATRPARPPETQTRAGSGSGSGSSSSGGSGEEQTRVEAQAEAEGEEEGEAQARGRVRARGGHEAVSE
jgi:hypothetical protein